MKVESRDECALRQGCRKRGGGRGGEKGTIFCLIWLIRH